MSDIIYTPPASSGGGTTINPTNDFIPVRSNATTFIDSVLFNDANTLSTNNSFGFYCDFSGRLFSIGDYQEGNNATYLSIDDNNQLIKTINQGNPIGLRLDFTYSTFYLGDFNGISNGCCFVADNDNGFLYNLANNVQFGFFIDGTNFVAFGDYNNLANGTSFYIDRVNQLIKTRNNNNDIGLLLDFANNTYNFGDYNGLVNFTYAIFDVNNKTIELSTNSATSLFLDGISDKFTFTTSYLNFVGATLQSNTSSGNSGQHLVITLNGTTYKIQLLNP